MHTSVFCVLAEVEGDCGLWEKSWILGELAWRDLVVKCRIIFCCWKLLEVLKEWISLLPDHFPSGVLSAVDQNTSLFSSYFCIQAIVIQEEEELHWRTRTDVPRHVYWVRLHWFKQWTHQKKRRSGGSKRNQWFIHVCFTVKAKITHTFRLFFFFKSSFMERIITVSKHHVHTHTHTRPLP